MNENAWECHICLMLHAVIHHTALIKAFTSPCPSITINSERWVEGSSIGNVWLLATIIDPNQSKSHRWQCHPINLGRNKPHRCRWRFVSSQEPTQVSLHMFLMFSSCFHVPLVTWEISSGSARKVRTSIVGIAAACRNSRRSLASQKVLHKFSCQMSKWQKVKERKDISLVK